MGWSKVEPITKMSWHAFHDESRQRQRDHENDTMRNPIPTTEAAVREWLASLSRLDAVDGPAAQLEICRDLLLYAPEDDMLSSDVLIIKRAMQQLEEELERKLPVCKRLRRMRYSGQHVRRSRCPAAPDDDC